MNKTFDVVWHFSEDLWLPHLHFVWFIICRHVVCVFLSKSLATTLETTPPRFAGVKNCFPFSELRVLAAPIDAIDLVLI